MTAEQQTAETATNTVAKKAAPEPQARKWTPQIGHLQPAYERRPVFLVEVPTGVTLDDVLEPGFWKHVWREMTRGGGKYAKIEVICEDQTWEAELRVYATGDGFVKTRVLVPWEAKKAQGRPPKLPEGWVAEPVGSTWRVRNSVGEPVVQNEASEYDAIVAASKLHKAMS